MSIRIVNFVVDGSRDIIAADSHGSLYRLDEHLRLKRQSPKTYHGAGIHTIAADDQWVFTRDVGGNVIRWRKDRCFPKISWSRNTSVPSRPTTFSRRRAPPVLSRCATANSMSRTRMAS